MKVSLVFDGDLNAMSDEEKTNFTDSAVYDLLNRFSNVTIDDVSSVTLTSGSILLEVTFTPGSVSVKEANAVVAEANKANPIEVHVGNATYSSSVTFIGMYTAPPSAAPTMSPTTSPTVAGSWCTDMSFGAQCTERYRPLVNAPRLEGTVFDKLAQCLNRCEELSNVGCCEFDMDTSLCYGYVTTFRPGSKVKSPRRQTVAASCIAGPRDRPTDPPPITTVTPNTVPDDNNARDSQHNTDLGISSRTQTLLLLGALGLVVLVAVGMTYYFLSKRISEAKPPPKDIEFVEEADYEFADPQPSNQDYDEARNVKGLRHPHLRHKTSEYLQDDSSEFGAAEWDAHIYDARRPSKPASSHASRSRMAPEEFRVFDDLMEKYMGLDGRIHSTSSPPSEHMSQRGSRAGSSVGAPRSRNGEDAIMFDVNNDAHVQEYQLASEFFDIMNGAVDESILEDDPADLLPTDEIEVEEGILRKMIRASTGATSYDNTDDVLAHTLGALMASANPQAEVESPLERAGSRGDGNIDIDRPKVDDMYDSLLRNNITDCDSVADSNHDDVYEHPIGNEDRRAKNMSRKVGNTTGSLSL